MQPPTVLLVGQWVPYLTTTICVILRHNVPTVAQKEPFSGLIRLELAVHLNKGVRLTGGINATGSSENPVGK